MSYRKIELSDKDVKLLNKSADHWRIISNKLRKGFLIVIDEYCSYTNKTLFWVNKIRIIGVPVNCYANDCPLCHEYLLRVNSCEGCPYKRFYGIKCDTHEKMSHWKKFENKPVLTNAIEMENALKRIIKYRKVKKIKEVSI